MKKSENTEFNYLLIEYAFFIEDLEKILLDIRWTPLKLLSLKFDLCFELTNMSIFSRHHFYGYTWYTKCIIPYEKEE